MCWPPASKPIYHDRLLPVLREYLENYRALLLTAADALPHNAHSSGIYPQMGSSRYAQFLLSLYERHITHEQDNWFFDAVRYRFHGE